MYIKIFIKRKLKFYAEENFYTTHKKNLHYKNCAQCRFAKLQKCKM